MSDRARATSAAVILALAISGCSGGGTKTTTPTGDAGGSTLSVLEGRWTATASNPRFTQRSGNWKDASVKIAGNQIEVSYRLGPSDHGSSSMSAQTGEFAIRCTSDHCSWGPFSVQEKTGPPYQIVSVATLQPPRLGCDLPAPPGAWVLRDVTKDSFSFSAVWSGGFGGAGGCAETFQVVWDVAATRVG